MAYGNGCDACISMGGVHAVATPSNRIPALHPSRIEVARDCSGIKGLSLDEYLMRGFSQPGTVALASLQNMREAPVDAQVAADWLLRIAATILSVIVAQLRP
jgi:hypothetical protein